MAAHTMPLLIYGTAFKADQTQTLTELALTNGFVAVDSANYPVSYNEPLVGNAVASVLQSGVDRRAIYTKFTPASSFGAHATPYDKSCSIENQIRQSLAQSLRHLQTDYIDCFLLHAPFPTESDTVAAWRVLEAFVPHTVRTLGISNVTLPQLHTIYDKAAHVKPSAVQNRFCRARGFDIELRAFCRDHGIAYQAFHVLRRNPDLLASDVVASVATTLGVSKELACLVLVLGLGGMQILDGTTKVERMVQTTSTVERVFSRNEHRLELLLPDIDNFRNLLSEMALSNVAK